MRGPNTLCTMAEPIPSTPQRKPAATSAPNTGPSPVKPGPASVPTDVSLAQQKQVMLDDLQEKVPQVDWEFFEDNILPPLPHKIDVDSVVTKLVKKQAVTMVEGEYRWTQFALGSPKDYNGHEDAIFANMSKIVSAIKGVASSAKAKRLFKCKPRTTPVSGTRDNNTRPDAYYLRNDAAVKDPIPRWTNIIIPAEFKIKDDPSSENTVSPFLYIDFKLLTCWTSFSELGTNTLVAQPPHARRPDPSVCTWVHHRGYQDASMVCESV